MDENILAITLLTWLYMKEDLRIVVKTPCKDSRFLIGLFREQTTSGGLVVRVD